MYLHPAKGPYSIKQAESKFCFFYAHVQSMFELCCKFRVVLGRAYRGLTGGFLLLRNFSVTISGSPHICFILSLNSDFYVSKIMHL